MVLDFPPRDEWVENKISKAIAARKELVENMGRRPYTEEEIENMRQEFAQNYPETEEERREWLIHHSRKLKENCSNTGNIYLSTRQQKWPQQDALRMILTVLSSGQRTALYES
jgi:hypothetical protein